MQMSPVHMPAAQMSQRKPTTGWYFAENYEEVMADMSNKTNSSFSTTKGTHFKKDECRLLLEIWEAEFQGFSDKIRITKGDWENLASMYSRQNYSARSAQQIENKIKNLKDHYKRVKDKMKTTGHRFDKIETDTEFSYSDIMDRVLGGNEKFVPSFILDPEVEQEQNDENHIPSENTKQNKCDREVSAIKSCTPGGLKKAVSSGKRKLSNSGSAMSGSSGATSSKSASTRSSKKTKSQNSGIWKMMTNSWPSWSSRLIATEN